MMTPSFPPGNAMDPISLEDLALLEVLKRIDQGVELVGADGEIRNRLIDGALVIDDADGIRLTPAGVELCKSFQHRVAADAQAARIVRERDESAAPNGDSDRKAVGST